MDLLRSLDARHGFLPTTNKLRWTTGSLFATITIMATMDATNATVGSLFAGTGLETESTLAACAAASGHRFQRGELPTGQQLRRMCQQSDCIVLMNKVLVNAKYYDAVVENMVPPMQEFVSPVLDYCYHLHTPSQPCPQDFAGQLMTDLREITQACEAKSGFPITKNRPPLFTVSPDYSGSGSNETLLQPLCGVAECDNIMKRLDMKQESTICPLSTNEQAVLKEYVLAYTRVCETSNSIVWTTINFYKVRALYYALPGPAAVATPTPTLPPASTPVSTTTTSPIVGSESRAEELSSAASTLKLNPSTSGTTTVTINTLQVTNKKLTNSTKVTVIQEESRVSPSSSSSGSGSRGDSVDKSGLDFWAAAVSGVPTATTPAPVEQSQVLPVISTQSELLPTNTALVGVLSGVAVLVITVCVFLLWRRRHRRSGRKLSIRGDDYHSLGTIASSSSSLDSVLNECRAIPTSQLTDLRVIGGGGNGVVYLVRYTGEDRAVHNGVLAAKRTKNSGFVSSSDQVDALVAEINLAASLSHPRVVTFVGVAGRNKTELQALFEYLPGGDLKRYLETLPALQPCTCSWTREKLQIAIDIADALVYLHTLQPTPVVHRDLKSRNVMLTSDKRAKLGDFGVSRPQSTMQSMTTGVGTSRWVAPEVILGGGTYTTACDIYSFGVVLSELDTHRIPFSELTNGNGEQLADFVVLEMIATERLQPSFSASCPPSMLDVAQRCLMYEPQARPSALEVAEKLRSCQQELWW